MFLSGQGPQITR